MTDFEEELKRIIEDMEKKEEEKWNNMTAKEKLNYYRELPLYKKYCDMSIEELKEEKEFNVYMANKLKNSKFSNPYYSWYGCNENVRRINVILKLMEVE